MLLQSSVSVAQNPPIFPLEHFEGRFRLGIEIEIVSQRFALGVHLFDFRQYQQMLLSDAGAWPALARQLPVAWVDEYLSQESTLLSLPEILREELTRGLDAYESIVVQGQVALPSDVRPHVSGREQGLERRSAGGLLLSGQGARGNLAESRPDAILVPGQGVSNRDGAGIDLGAGQRPSTSGLRGSDSIAGRRGPEANGSGLVVSPLTRQAARWSEIQRRWRQLPLDRRLGVLQLSHLPASRLASLCVKSRELGWPDLPPIDVRRVRVRPDADPDVLTLLQNWEWVNDGTTVEFRLRGAMLLPRELLRQSLRVSEIFGSSQYRGLLRSTNEGTAHSELAPSVHLHQSTVDGSSLRTAAEVENFSRLLWGLARGEQVLEMRGSVFYNSMIDFKGLVRVVPQDPNAAVPFPDDSRKESRHLQGTLEQELARILSLNEDPLSYFKAALALLTPERREQIFSAEFGAERLAANLLGITRGCQACGASPEYQTMLVDLLPRLQSRRPGTGLLEECHPGVVLDLIRAAYRARPREEGTPPWLTQGVRDHLLRQAESGSALEVQALVLLRQIRELQGAVLDRMRTAPPREGRTRWLAAIQTEALSPSQRLDFFRMIVEEFAPRSGSSPNLSPQNGESISSSQGLEGEASAMGARSSSALRNLTLKLQELTSLSAEEAELLLPLLRRENPRIRGPLMRLLATVAVPTPILQTEIVRALERGGIPDAIESALRAAALRGRNGPAPGASAPALGAGQCPSLQSIAGTLRHGSR